MAKSEEEEAIPASRFATRYSRLSGCASFDFRYP